MNKTTKFLQALSGLSDPELNLFWQFIADKAKRLPDNTKLRSALCEAVAKLRVGRDQPRTITGKSHGFRALSKDELHKAVLARRESLIPFIEKCYDWKALIANWILATRRDQVITVLNAFSCPHDGNGHLQGSPPELAPEEATQRIMALSSQISFADLEVITAGLLGNHEGWNYLDQVVNRLHEEAQRTREAAQMSAQCPEPTSMTVPQFSNDTTARVQALRGQMNTLIAYLQDVIAELQAGRLPEITAITSKIEPLRTEFTALVTELRPTDESLEGLTAASQVREELTEVFAALDRLQCLRHQREPDFPGIAEIHQRCDEIRSLVKTATANETLTKDLKPFHALKRLVNEHAELDDAEFATLRTEVAAHFGEQVANAAGRGRLEWREPQVAIEPDTPNEPDDGPTASPPKETDVPVTTPIDPSPQATTETADASPEPSPPPPEEPTPAEPPTNLTIVTTAPVVPPEPPPTAELPSLTPEPPPTPLTPPTPEPPAAEPRPFDDALCSFQSFQQAFWLNPSGQVVEAPWRDRKLFAAELTEAVYQALDRREFGVVFLLLCALDDLTQPSPWTLDDWQCAEAISESPAVISVGLSHARTQRLQAAIGGATLAAGLGLALFLEAVRPDPASTFSRRDVERLMETKPFNDHHLTQVVDYLFQSNTVGIDPLAMLKVQMAHGSEISREQLVAEVNQGCRRLRKQIAQIWSAAGGRIQHTHCRNAWKKFVEAVIQPLRDQLPTTDNPDNLIARLSDLRTGLRQLTKAYTQIMDDAEVRLRDRKTADRSANELAGLFKDLLDSAERLQTLTHSTRPTVSPIPTSAVRHLLDNTATFPPIEELCRQIFLRLIGQSTDRRPLRMDPRWLRDHPALIGEIDLEVLSESGFISDGLPIRAFRPPHLAAAAILCLHPLDDADPITPGDHLLAEIRERALEAYPKRPDLLSGLSTVPHLLLESSDRNRLHRSASELSDDVFKAGEALIALARDCQSLDLAGPIQVTLQPAIDETRRRADVGITHAGLADGLLLKGWIDALIQFTTTTREQALASYRQAINDQPHLVAEFEAAIAHHDLRRIPSLLSGHESIGAATLPVVRRTPGAPRTRSWRSYHGGSRRCSSVIGTAARRFGN